MREIITIIKEHKIIIVIICALLIAFIGWSVFQFMSVHSKSDEDILSETNTEEHIDDTSQTVEDAYSKLTDRQKKIIRDYTDIEKEIIAFLKNNSWITENQTGTLMFTDTTYTETVGADIKSHPFAITAVYSDHIVGDGASYMGEIFSVETDNKTFIIKKWQWVSDDGSASEWILSSDGFENATEYVRTAAADNFEVRGLNEDASALYGGQEKLTNSIRDFTTQAYPTASVASWREDVSIDYRNNLVTTSFTLNTKASNVITVIYNRTSGEISIE